MVKKIKYNISTNFSIIYDQTQNKHYLILIHYRDKKINKKIFNHNALKNE